MKYEHNPAAIYQKSFAIVRKETSISRFPEELVPIVQRIVHACGMPDIADAIRHSANLTQSASKAISAGCPILCDSTMTATGIIQRLIPNNCNIHAPTFNTALAEKAKQIGTTQSAIIIEQWQPILSGALVVIGNAPTALFRLIELIQNGASRPAAIIGCPVGFVGAAESKQELANQMHQLEYLTILGRRGGSAMAAAAVNALLVQADAEQTS